MSRIVRKARIGIDLAIAHAVGLLLEGTARTFDACAWAEPYARVGLNNHIAQLREKQREL